MAEENFRQVFTHIPRDARAKLKSANIIAGFVFGGGHWEPRSSKRGQGTCDLKYIFQCHQSTINSLERSAVLNLGLGC